MVARGILVVVALSMPPAAALAVLPDEIQVYTNDLVAPGERSIELHVNTTPKGRGTPDFPGEVTSAHGLRVTPELTWGLTQSTDFGLYLPVVRDAEGRLLFGGPKIRYKWLPLRPAEDGAGWFVGANGEYSMLNRNFETATRKIELRPILGWRDRDWLFAANPVLDWALNGPDRGRRPDFNPSFKIAHTAAQGVALGFEYYAELGRLGRPLASAAQLRTLYVAMEWERGPIPFHLAVGRGLNDATDRWTVKAIFEFPFK